MNLRVTIAVSSIAFIVGCSSSSSDHSSGPDSGATGGAPETGGTGASTGGTGGASTGGQASSSGGSSGTPPSTGGANTGGTNTGGASTGGKNSGGAGGGSPPTPTGGWTNVTANLANMASECGNLSHLSAKPDEDELIAGIAQKGLWASTDGGGSWHQIGAGAGSDTITNRTSSLLFDPDHPDQYWESGIYNAGGVYLTTDDGATFHALGTVHHDDLISVDFTDPARKTMLAGGHEQTQTLYRSTDGGATWDNVGTNLPSGTNFSSFPLVIDAQTHLVGLSGYAGGTSGVFRTTDGGKTWAQVTSSGGFGAPLWAASGDIYWASSDGMAKSTDQGAHFTDIAANGQLKTTAPLELPDGRIATVGSQAVMVSSDGAMTWQSASTALPYGDATGLTYSTQQKAFFIWHFSCNDNVPTDAIMRFDFDYTKN
jgi:hypothetical protein